MHNYIEDLIYELDLADCSHTWQQELEAHDRLPVELRSVIDEFPYPICYVGLLSIHQAGLVTDELLQALYQSECHDFYTVFPDRPTERVDLQTRLEQSARPRRGLGARRLRLTDYASQMRVLQSFPRRARPHES